MILICQRIMSLHPLQIVQYEKLHGSEAEHQKKKVNVPCLAKNQSETFVKTY